MKGTQGTEANRSGQWLEREVEGIVNEAGCPSIQRRKIGPKFIKMLEDTNAPGFIVKNPEYINAYGGTSRGDFLLKLSGMDPIRIECRNQNVSGSADEKMFYLLACCSSCEEKDSILVVEGKGARRGAIEFAKYASKYIPGKSVKVMTLRQFSAWFNKTMRRFEVESTVEEVNYLQA